MAARRCSDAEEEGIEGVRASIESYLAKFNAGIAKKEAAIVQARSDRPSPGPVPSHDTHVKTILGSALQAVL